MILIIKEGEKVLEEKRCYDLFEVNQLVSKYKERGIFNIELKIAEGSTVGELMIDERRYLALVEDYIINLKKRIIDL